MRRGPRRDTLDDDLSTITISPFVTYIALALERSFSVGSGCSPDRDRRHCAVKTPRVDHAARRCGGARPIPGRLSASSSSACSPIQASICPSSLAPRYYFPNTPPVALSSNAFSKYRRRGLPVMERSVDRNFAHIDRRRRRLDSRGHRGPREVARIGNPHIRVSRGVSGVVCSGRNAVSGIGCAIAEHERRRAATSFVSSRL